MNDPYRTSGDNGPTLGESMSDVRLAIKVAIPCFTLIILGFTTCVAAPEIIEAQKFDPYFEGYCHDEMHVVIKGRSDKCNHSKHTALFLHNEDGTPAYMICKCEGQPLIMKPLTENLNKE